MCNCGSKRQQLSQPATAERSPIAVQARTAHVAVEFEYTGRTALTVLGPFSGKRYRFDRPGARVRADHRDAESLTAVQALRRC